MSSQKGGVQRFRATQIFTADDLAAAMGGFQRSDHDLAGEYTRYQRLPPFPFRGPQLMELPVAMLNGGIYDLDDIVYSRRRRSGICNHRE